MFMKKDKILNYIFYAIIVINVILDIAHIIVSFYHTLTGGCHYRILTSSNTNLFFIILVIIHYNLPIIMSFLYLYKKGKYKNKISVVLLVIVLIILSFLFFPANVLAIIYIKENYKKHNKILTILIGLIAILTNPPFLFSMANSILSYNGMDLFDLLNVDRWYSCFSGFDPYF